MARSEFGLGVLLGGLAGVAIGYLIRQTANHPSEETSAPDTIDLTPALQRRNAAGGAATGTAAAVE
jgi:hypothetical protein